MNVFCCFLINHSSVVALYEWILHSISWKFSWRLLVNPSSIWMDPEKSQNHSEAVMKLERDTNKKKRNSREVCDKIFWKKINRYIVLCRKDNEGVGADDKFCHNFLSLVCGYFKHRHAKMIINQLHSSERAHIAASFVYFDPFIGGDVGKYWRIYWPFGERSSHLSIIEIFSSSELFLFILEERKICYGNTYIYGYLRCLRGA